MKIEVASAELDKLVKTRNTTVLLWEKSLSLWEESNFPWKNVWLDLADNLLAKAGGPSLLAIHLQPAPRPWAHLLHACECIVHIQTPRWGCMGWGSILHMQQKNPFLYLALKESCWKVSQGSGSAGGCCNCQIWDVGVWINPCFYFAGIIQAWELKWQLISRLFCLACPRLCMCVCG